jgi:hypothetical protein
MIETLIWVAIAVAIGGIVWAAEPSHTRMIVATHERLRQQ